MPEFEEVTTCVRPSWFIKLEKMIHSILHKVEHLGPCIIQSKKLGNFYFCSCNMMWIII